VRRQRHFKSRAQRDNDSGMVVVVVGQQDISRPGPFNRGDNLKSLGRGIDYQAFARSPANDGIGVGLPGSQGQLIDAYGADIDDGSYERFPFALRC
jgi:hypothetical protein